MSQKDSQQLLAALEGVLNDPAEIPPERFAELLREVYTALPLSADTLDAQAGIGLQVGHRTVARWRAGQICPLPRMRREALRWLRRRVVYYSRIGAC